MWGVAPRYPRHLQIYEKFGRCKYGANCKFQHKESEDGDKPLKVPPMHHREGHLQCPARDLQCLLSHQSSWQCIALCPVLLCLCCCAPPCPTLCSCVQLCSTQAKSDTGGEEALTQLSASHSDGTTTPVVRAWVGMMPLYHDDATVP